MSSADLRQQLRSLNVRLSEQEATMRDYALENDIEPHQLRSANGHFMFADLYAARAQVLSSLAMLEKK